MPAEIPVGRRERKLKSRAGGRIPIDIQSDSRCSGQTHHSRSFQHGCQLCHLDHVDMAGPQARPSTFDVKERIIDLYDGFCGDMRRKTILSSLRMPGQGPKQGSKCRAAIPQVSGVPVPSRSIPSTAQIAAAETRIPQRIARMSMHTSEKHSRRMAVRATDPLS